MYTDQIVLLITLKYVRKGQVSRKCLQVYLFIKHFSRTRVSRDTAQKAEERARTLTRTQLQVQTRCDIPLNQTYMPHSTTHTELTCVIDGQPRCDVYIYRTTV